MTKETVEFEIYFNDLKPEVQKQLLRTVSASWPDQMNWDTLPVTVLCFKFEKVNSEEERKKGNTRIQEAEKQMETQLGIR